MNKTSLEATAFSTTQFITQSLLDNRHWRFFGFPGVPRVGRFWDIFRAKSAYARIAVLSQELPVASLAQIAAWLSTASRFQYRELFLARVMEMSIDGLQTPVWTAYGFTDRDEALQYFSTALLNYGAVPAADHMRVFVQRTIGRLSADVQKVWIVGVAALYVSPESMMPHIHRGLQEATCRTHYECDIELRDPCFLQIAKTALRSSVHVKKMA